MKRRGALVAVGLAVVLTCLLSPQAAMAKRAANYGYDWASLPYHNFDLYDAADRAAYYQQLMGYTTMTRDRGTGANIYDKLAGTDPNTYQVINVISHASAQHLLSRPHDEDGYMSCLYDSPTTIGDPHAHTVERVPNGGLDVFSTVQRGRLQALSGVPSVKWMVLQGCHTAAGNDNLTRQAYIEGVDIAVGFQDEIWFGGSGFINGETWQYNFSARYWKSLYEGKTGNQAIADAVEQVRENDWPWEDDMGYSSGIEYGLDDTLN